MCLEHELLGMPWLLGLSNGLWLQKLDHLRSGIELLGLAGRERLPMIRHDVAHVLRAIGLAKSHVF